MKMNNSTATPKSQLAELIEAISTSEMPLKEISENGKILIAKLANHILGKSGLSFQTFKDNGTISYYDFNTNEGIWRLDGKEKIRAYTLTKIQNEAPDLDGQLSRFVMDEILARVKWSTYMDRSEFQTKPEHVCVNNGVFDLTTGKLKPHNPGFNFLSKIPVDYVPSEDCPEIDKFLVDVLGDRKQLFYEWAGYCLEPGNKYQRAFVAVGGGDNGKSTALGVLRTFLGDLNVSSRSLQELCEDRFAVADLYGKLANIHADIPGKPLLETGRFKMLTGGDRITAEHKFQRSFQFVNQAKLVFSANILPESYDDSDAFHKRMMLLAFDKTIPPEKQDRDLLAKLTTSRELSGLLNRAVEAYRTMKLTGKFHAEGTIDDKRKYYTKLSDPVQTFIDDRIEIDDVAETVKQELYAEFLKHCESQKYGKVISQKAFFKQFLAKTPSGRVSDGQRRDPGQPRIRIYQGVRLLPNNPDPTQNAQILPKTLRITQVTQGTQHSPSLRQQECVVEIKRGNPEYPEHPEREKSTGPALPNFSEPTPHGGTGGTGWPQYCRKCGFTARFPDDKMTHNERGCGSNLDWTTHTDPAPISSPKGDLKS
jgi:putative DNA primase/helicase